MRRQFIRREDLKAWNLTLRFDFSDPEERACYQWIKAAGNGGMTRRIKELILLGMKARQEQKKKGQDK